ncbi:MAG: biosynthetic peptidoglycan transglycosylase [Myxococcota bacterium]
MKPGRPKTGRLRRAAAWVVGVGAVATLAFFAWVVAVPFPEEVLAHGDVTSTRIVDRDGRLLYEVPTASDTRGRWVALSDISPHLVQATLEAEDRRFYDHAGIDGLAILRSAWVNAEAGRVVTGASTITQQLVKLTLQRDEPRTLETKLAEAVWAWRLERSRARRTTSSSST